MGSVDLSSNYKSQLIQLPSIIFNIFVLMSITNNHTSEFLHTTHDLLSWFRILDRTNTNREKVVCDYKAHRILRFICIKRFHFSDADGQLIGVEADGQKLHTVFFYKK